MPEQSKVCCVLLSNDKFFVCVERYSLGSTPQLSVV
jgi:hypothetical protein